MDTVKELRREAAPVASVSDDARGLTHDGRARWTCYRDLNEIVSLSA